MSGKLNHAEVTAKPVLCCKRFESCMVEQKTAQHLKKKTKAMFTHFECVFTKEADGSLYSLRGIPG